mgnify:CR=1 FL=1
MTSKKRIQINSKVSKMSEGLSSFVGKKQKKDVAFMGDKVTIYKLNVTQVMEIQDMAKGAGEDEDANFNLLKAVIRMATVGAAEMSDEDFDSFAIDDLSKLSGEIMKFSGIGAEGKGK